MSTTADPARPQLSGRDTRFGRSLQAVGTAPGPTGTRTQLAVFLAVPTRQNTLHWNTPLPGEKLDRSFLAQQILPQSVPGTLPS